MIGAKINDLEFDLDNLFPKRKTKTVYKPNKNCLSMDEPMTHNYNDSQEETNAKTKRIKNSHKCHDCDNDELKISGPECGHGHCKDCLIKKIKEAIEKSDHSLVCDCEYEADIPIGPLINISRYWM